ncbi:ester cyclase [Danxiaibacter flavus]|uniref:Ester cyclase n=1 Tax=Danxiaibacter flavus TaxID=3049108 RepID=A0ABV3ZBW2_9BACT|nr:ester cyclase [Chitinophagaceae bacterium DXS]
MKAQIIPLAIALLLTTSCTSNQSSSTQKDTTAATSNATDNKEAMEEKNKATALASIQGFNTHSVDQIFKDAAPDMIDYGDGTDAGLKGRDSIKALMKDFFTSFPDMKGENLLALADGNKVVVFGDWSGTFKGEFMGKKPTGKSFKFKDADLYTFNDAGQIIEHRGVQNMSVFWAQVGAK